MPRLIWTPEALDDVNRLYLFLANRSHESASKAATLIMTETDKLLEFPEIGRPAEFINMYCRELLVPFAGSGYVVLYRFDGQYISILAVKHQFEVGYEPDFIE